MRCVRSGFTLVELLVVISVTMLLASIAVGGARRALSAPSEDSAPEKLHREAVMTNVPRTSRITSREGAVVITAFGDGTVLVDTLPPRDVLP